uniref:CvpA family protein n=1 Tax=candidate division WOR-3 bacterium TaxID=2052148 RepID=A0A7C4THD0_UNCW3
MTWIDILILIIIFALMIQGVITGLIRGVFDIAGIIFGYIISLKYSPILGIPKILSFILIFLAVVIVFSILGRIISKLIHYTPLGAMDRLLGGLLGVAKGIIISFIFLLVLILLNKEETIKKSEIAPIIWKTGITATQLLPEDWHEWIKKLKFRQKPVYASLRQVYGHHYLHL